MVESNIDYSKEILRQNERILFLLLVLIIITVLFLFVILPRSEKKDFTLFMDDISETREIGKLNKIVRRVDSLFLDIEYPSIGCDEIDRKINNIVQNKIDLVENNYSKKENNYYYFLKYEIYVGDGNIASLILNDRVDNIDLKNVENKKEIYYFSLDKRDSINVNDIFNEEFEEKKKELGINSDSFYIKKDKIIYGDKEIELNEVKDYVKIDVSNSKDYANDTPSKVSTVVNKEYTVNQDVVMYDSDSINRNIIKTITRGTIIKVHSNINNGFSMVFYEDGIGYVVTSNLVEVTKDNVVINTDRVTMYVIENTSVRLYPDKKSDKIGDLKYGDTVTKNGEIGDWIRIDYNGIDGYIKKGSVSSKKTEKNPVEIDVIRREEIDSSKPMVAITFDDGPNNTSTVKILDTLEKYNVKATFFDLGKLMLKYPDVVKREAKLGEVGTHTYNHLNLNQLSEEQLQEELNLSINAYKQVLGVEPKLLRPPYGNANGLVKSYITSMAIINWNVDSLDWKYRNKELILKEIDKYGDLNGKIILMHSIHPATAEAFEELVPKLLDMGYQLVTISEMAKYRNYTLETGTVFYQFK